MPNINVNINGRGFSVACQEGEESRVQDLANYVDEKTRIITRSGIGISENQVLMLTCLLLADEVKSSQSSSLDEAEILEKIEILASKITNLQKI
jgi:cell division protein ZapA